MNANAEPKDNVLGVTTGKGVKATGGAGKSALAGGGKDGSSETTSLVPGGFMTRVQASGDGFEYPVGIWASYSHSGFEDNFAVTNYDADSDSVFLGVDFTPWDNYVFGVALGYDVTDINATFNAGEQNLDTFSVIPYMAIGLAEALETEIDLSLDMSVGFSSVDVSQFRSLNNVVGGARISSSTSSDRFFGRATSMPESRWATSMLALAPALLYAVDQTDGFTDSAGNVVGAVRTELGQVSVGGGIAYLFNDYFEPYVNAAYRHDYELARSAAAGHPNDDTDVLVAVGLRFYTDAWSGGFEYSRSFAPR